ncbi:MAG TPA: class I SAM-dependent methyltransferase, partial [Bradyrhizobium sp.]|nr:class I SAM-dependent methyltransferase [Bradyrhizobium sp.]
MTLDSFLFLSKSLSWRSRFLNRMIVRLLPQPESGQLRIILPNGVFIDLGGGHDGCHLTMTVRRWCALWRMLRAGEIGFSDSYIAGDWSTTDLVGVLDFFLRNERAFATLANSRIGQFFDRLRHRANENTKMGSRKNIAAHYDLGNEFYRHWLDGGMNYSSAIYDSELSLEAAQQNKLARISRHLDLKGGERVLEIGCGWGALTDHLVRNFNAIVTGVTLSRAQLAY